MPTDSGIFRDDTDTPVGGRIVRAYRRDTGALIGSAVSSDGLAVPGDANLTDRVLLVRANGGSIVDECPTPRAITSYGNAAITTSTVKYGAGAIDLDGSGAYLGLDGHSSLAFGAGDFTVELWFYPRSLAASASLFDFRPGSTNGAYPGLFIEPDGTILYYANSGGQISAAHGMSTLAWHHIALCRSSGVTRVFVGGQQKGFDYPDASEYLVGAGRPVFGALGFSTSLYNANCVIDDIRASRRAEYTSNFTPPAQQFYANAPSAATPLGSYSITHSHTGERQFVFLDDAGGTTYNDKILRVA